MTQDTRFHTGEKLCWQPMGGEGVRLVSLGLRNKLNRNHFTRTEVYTFAVARASIFQKSPSPKQKLLMDVALDCWASQCINARVLSISQATAAGPAPAQRMYEIQQVVCYLAEKTRDETAWACSLILLQGCGSGETTWVRNLVLLGDLNIYRPLDPAVTAAVFATVYCNR